MPRYGIHRFLLAASGSFSRFATYGLSTSRPLSVCNRAVTRPINACVICNCVFSAGVETGIKKRPSSSALGKDEKRYVQSTHGFRGTTFIRRHLSIATSLGRGAIYKLAHSTCPITGATGKVYSRSAAISACSIRVFFAGCLLWAFHQSPTLCMQRDLLLSHQSLCVISLLSKRYHVTRSVSMVQSHRVCGD